MVHNGIEYGDMQLICEAYHLMKDALGMQQDEMSDVSCLPLYMLKTTDIASIFLYSFIETYFSFMCMLLLLENIKHWIKVEVLKEVEKKLLLQFN